MLISKLSYRKLLVFVETIHSFTFTILLNDQYLTLNTLNAQMRSRALSPVNVLESTLLVNQYEPAIKFIYFRENIEFRLNTFPTDHISIKLMKAACLLATFGRERQHQTQFLLK